MQEGWIWPILSYGMLVIMCKGGLEGGKKHGQSSEAPYYEDEFGQAASLPRLDQLPLLSILETHMLTHVPCRPLLVSSGTNFVQLLPGFLG